MGSCTAKGSARTISSENNFYPREEVKKHNTLTDLWVVVDGNVYDISKWIPKHPGGTVPMTYAGEDATEAFFRIHNKGVLERHKEYLIGHTTPQPEVKAEPLPASAYDTSADPMGYDLRKAGEVKGSWGRGREFGDLMAQEGEVSRLPLVIGLVYLAVFAWGGLAAVLARCHYLTVPAFHFAGMVGYYAWHRIAHENWSGTIHKVHMRHHLITFPPSDFYGEAASFAQMYPNGQPTIWSLMQIWRSVNTSSAIKPRDQAIHLSPLIAFMLAILLCGYFVCKCSGLTILFVFIMYATIAIAGNAFHMSFHVRGFHLEKYEWYKQLRMVHYIHHLGPMNTDFIMVSMQFDWFFGSLRVRDPARKGINEPLLEGEEEETVPSV